MKYKLLAIDMDGTMLNSNGEISQGNKQAVRTALDSGLNVTICSGRSQSAVAVFNEELGLNKAGCFGISFNGGVVYKADTMETLYESRLKKEYAIEVIKRVKKIHRDAPIIAYMNEDLIYYEFEDEYISRYTKRMGITKIKVENLESAVNGDVLKMIIRWKPECLVEIADGIREDISSYCALIFSDKNLLEFSQLGINKYAGVSFVASRMGISMDEVAAIGDYHNDYEMIKNAGFGVAVKNAADEIKEVAAYITNNDNNNSAVKEVIEKLLEQHI